MGYRYQSEEIDMYLIEFEPSPTGIMHLSSLPHVKGVATNLQEASTILQKVSEEADTRISVRPQFGFQEWDAKDFESTYSPVVVFIDEAGLFMQQTSMDFTIKDLLEKIMKESRQRNIHFTLSGSLNGMNSYMHEPWMVHFKKKYAGFLLGSTLSNDLFFFNIRLPHGETDKELPAGDGFMIRGKQTRIKVPLPYENPQDIRKWMVQDKLPN